MKLGIISDIHEDIIRLKQSLTLCEQQNVDELICLGDMVGFSAPYYIYYKTRNANEVINIVKNNFKTVVIGNHDLYAIKRIPHNCNFDYPPNWYSLDYPTQKTIACNKIFLYETDLPTLLSSENKDYLSSLPEYKVQEYGSCRILFSHYAYPDLTGCLSFNVEYSSDLNQHFEFMTKNNCVISISGNDHFEGINVFSPATESIVNFSSSSILSKLPLWLHGPTISKGTYKNGFMIYDTEKKCIKAIPLYSSTHTPLSD